MQNLDHIDEMIRDNQSPGSAPKITIDDLTAEIAEVYYFTAADGVHGERQLTGIEKEMPRSLGLLTFCVIVLKNGFTCTGESACVSAANYDQAYGERLAYKKAQDKAWSYLAFRLADRLAAAKL